MSLPVAQSLTELDDLDRSSLYVFVAGPGTGEGIAIALPTAGWVLIDGCRALTATDTDLPLQWILNKYRSPDESVEAMILTHPHSDHADGFGELVGSLDPKAVAVASPNPPGPTLDALFTSTPAAIESEAVRRVPQVKAAFQAIQIWVEGGKTLTRLSDTCSLAFGSTKLCVRAPTSAELAGRLSGRTSDSVRDVANPMSLVMVLELGTTQILLGGDMPATQQRTVVQEGWEAIRGRHNNIGKACAFKIPHHGSKEALHGPTLGDAPPDACWWITPFAAHKLPQSAEDATQGMNTLLAHQATVQVTSFPTRKAAQIHVPPPGQIPLASWGKELSHSPPFDGDAFAPGAAEVGPPTGAGPGDAIWVGRFNDKGEWTGRWRGSVAIEVVRDPPSAVT